MLFCSDYAKKLCKHNPLRPEGGGGGGVCTTLLHEQIRWRRKFCSHGSEEFCFLQIYSADGSSNPKTFDYHEHEAELTLQH